MRHDTDRPAARAAHRHARRLSRLTDQDIQRALGRAILEGRLAPGARLPEARLGDIFRVSRTRIRPILHRLAQSRIIVIEPRRGAFVASPSLAEACAVNAARRIIEEAIVRNVVPNITTRQIALLEQNVERETEARLRSDLATAHALTGEFHLLIAGFTGNDVVVETVRDLISRDSLAVALHQSRGAVSCSLSGHSRLIKAMASRDEAAAAACMVEHLAEIEAGLAVAKKQRGTARALEEAFADLSPLPAASAAETLRAGLAG